MSVVTDYPDYSPHVANAQQIAATGVPLLHAKNLVDSQTSRVITGASTFPGVNRPVGQTSYEISATFSIGGAATVPFAQVLLQWIDTATGNVLATDTFIIPASSSGPAFQVTGAGPAKADSVKLSVANLDPAVSMTVNYALYQTSRVVLRDDWKWLNGLLSGAIIPGWNLPTLPSDESVLGMLGGVNVPGSSSNTYLFGMHNGLIAVALDQGGGPWTNISVKIAAQPNSSYAINNQVYAAVSPPPAFTIAGPRAPLRVILTNTATSAFTATMSLIRAD